MAAKLQRIGIVGASSLLGKELNDELAESTLSAADLVLLDADEAAAGQLVTAGDEPSLIQRLGPGSFEGLDFIFFAGTPEVTREHWRSARLAGSTVIDLSGALEDQPGVLVRAPWLRSIPVGKETQVDGSGKGSPLPDLNTAAVVAADPAAVMLALVAARLRSRLPVERLIATVLEPASEFGRAAMDELHQQTVSLLSFHDLPREQFDAQVAFNLLPQLGKEAKCSLGDAQQRIERHYAAVSGGALPPLDLQLLQAPVFHGHTASILVEFANSVALSEVEEALSGEHVDLITEDSDPPSNLSASGQRGVLARVRSAGGQGGQRYWLFLATDNLKLAAANALACAIELRRFRPQGKVQ